MNLVPRSIVWAFGVAMFLVLVKPFKSILPIVMGEVVYRLVSKYLCLLFCDFFYSFIISLFWCGHHRWVHGGGSWCLDFFRYPSQSDGVVGEHCKCFQHHFPKTIIRVSTFPFRLIFWCPMSFFSSTTNPIWEIHLSSIL